MVIASASGEAAPGLIPGLDALKTGWHSYADFNVNLKECFWQMGILAQVYYIQFNTYRE